VADNGVGMSPETRAHVFEPFFTTKEMGRGTGLGLATVYGVVKQSEGYVWLESEPGQGARFEIYLPRVDQRPEGLDLVIDETGLPGGHETILVVEDEEEVRTLTREALQLAGYTVQEARDGHEALRVSSPPAAPPDLLLTDVAMPQMGGRTLADRLTARHPCLRVLYMSGHTDDTIVHHGVLDPGVDVVQKPFTPDALARRVREILDRPGRRAGAELPAHPA
jgi:CheY-like chemotaxis protein